MNKTYIFIIGILALASCEYKVDNSNPYKVAEALHKGLSNNDNTILKKVFTYEMDSMSKISLENLNRAKSYFKKIDKIKLFKVDTLKDLFGRKILNIYLKKDNVYHKVETLYESDSTKTIKLMKFYFTNINESCEEDKNKPYKPIHSINFKRIIWQTDHYEKLFKYGAIELQNNTESDINYIKFKVILKRGKHSWSSETFFNQTIESYKTIYKGDIEKIEVPGMKDYYTGFLIKRDDLFFDTELIDVKPKPESRWCIKLKELQDEEIKNKN